MRFFLSRTSQKYLSKLEKEVRSDIISAIEKLPDEGDVRKMRGKRQSNVFRLRVGKFRVLYVREKDDIRVIDIDTRGDIYK